MCRCYNGNTGDTCEISPTVTLTSPQASTNTFWIVIVAIVSAIAGLLLITSLTLCICYIVRKRRQAAAEPGGPTDQSTFKLPRAHVPTAATVGQGFNDWDGFSLDQTYDDQNNGDADSVSSTSNTTYNATYRTNASGVQADFGIFEELERQIPMAKGPIPRPQMTDMLGTLNSLSQDPFEEPSAGENSFSQSRDLNEIELVTDMLDDMTKDDDVEDDFVEALNPNLAIPRSALKPEPQPSSWFSVSCSTLTLKNLRRISFFVLSVLSKLLITKKTSQQLIRHIEYVFHDILFPSSLVLISFPFGCGFSLHLSFFLCFLLLMTSLVWGAFVLSNLTCSHPEWSVMTGKYLQHWKDETVTGFFPTLISVSIICFSSTYYFSLSLSLDRLFNKNPIAYLVGWAEDFRERPHNMDLFRHWNNNHHHHHRNKTARLKQTNELIHSAESEFTFILRGWTEISVRRCSWMTIHWKEFIEQGIDKGEEGYIFLNFVHNQYWISMDYSDAGGESNGRSCWVMATVDGVDGEGSVEYGRWSVEFGTDPALDSFLGVFVSMEKDLVFVNSFRHLNDKHARNEFSDQREKTCLPKGDQGKAKNQREKQTEFQTERKRKAFHHQQREASDTASGFYLQRKRFRWLRLFTVEFLVGFERHWTLSRTITTVISADRKKGSSKTARR